METPQSSRKGNELFMVREILLYNQLTDFVDNATGFGGLRVSKCNQVSDQVDLPKFA